MAKAWTCAAHIVSSGGDVLREGYLLTVDDRMYWDKVYENLAGQQEHCWECNECGSREFTDSVSESDLEKLACTSCGCNEFHKVNQDGALKA